MDFLLFLLVCLPLLSFLYLLSSFIKTTSRFSCPPGPRRLHFIGNLHRIDNSSLHTSLWKLSKSYGPIVSLRPLLRGLQRISYDGLEVAFSPFNGNWKGMRKIFTNYLLSPKMIQSSRYIREDEVSRAMKMIHGLACSSKQVNLSEITHIVMNTFITRMGFGKRYEDGNESKKIFRLLHELQETIINYYISDLWPGLPFMGLIDRLTGKSDRLEKCVKELDSFYQELIDEHIYPQNQKSNKECEDLIDILMQLQKDQVLHPFELTNDHIKAILMDLLVAGTDNSAATLVWAMTALMKNPKVMKKAQEEVRNMVHEKGEVGEDDLPKLTYLNAAVKEVLRLYPPAPLLIPREAKKDTIIHGDKIKQKTTVYVNALAIGRDPGSWENPKEFLPERFLSSDISFKGSDFELIPFGAGWRMCPGMPMGFLSVELMLANLLYLFDWELPDGMKKEDIDFEGMPGLIMTKKDDLCLLAKVYSEKATT